MATTLAIGDIAIVHYDGSTDTFSFVFLRDVEAGTTVNFTDNGWLAGGGFRAGEDTVTYSAPTAIPAGTIVTLSGLDLGAAGDQIIAYQGDPASPTLLYAIDFGDGNGAFAGDATSSTTSALPTGLTPGVTALALPFDNAAYTGSTSGTPLDLLEAIGDATRWTGDDLVPQPRGADLVTFDRPTVDLDFNNSTHIGRDYETSVVRGGPATQIADTDVRVDEASGLFLTSMTIRVFEPDFGDQLSVNGSLPFGITASFYNPFTGSLTLSGLATSSDYQTAIRQVEFSTTDGPTGSTKRVQVTAFDGAASSFEATTFIHVLLQAAAAAPVLDLDANNSNGGGADYTATYTAGGPGTPIADIDVSISDVDSITLQSARITILSWALQPGDVLSIAGSLPSGITASSFNPVSGVITLSGTASLADYQTALRHVVYSSTNPVPSTGDRGIQVVVNDGGLDSNIATTYMHVVVPPPNVPPVLNLDADSSTTGGSDYLTTFTDGGPPVAIADTDTLIIDSDSPNLTSAAITLTNPQTDDVLVFNGAPPAGISVSGSGTTAIALTGSASRAAYETALEQITFNNTGTNPTSDTRVIDVVVNDGIANSNTAHAIVEVTEVNNSAPVLDLDANNSTAPGTAFRGTFTENGAPVPIADTDTLVTDIDSENLASATITLTHPKAGDLLTIVGTLPGGIEATVYDPVTGVLTLTTVSGPRSLADYASALEQVRFSTGGDDPVAGTRIIEVVVNDGANDGDTATALITVAAVNDAPSITVDGAATYVEGAASVVLSPSALVGDQDNTDFAYALVQITAGSFAGDGDELTIAGLTSGSLGGIAWEWDPDSHAMLLTGTGAVGSYESLLQSVEFKSTGDNPTDYNASTTRTLTWTVSDGTAQTTATSLLNIVARNDAPAVTVAAIAAYTENSAPVTISPAAIVTDADNLQLAAGQVAITAGAFTGDALTVNGLESGTFAGINFSYDSAVHSLQFTLAEPIADYQSFLQAIQFHSTSDDPANAGANPTRTLSWTVFDGRDVSTAETTTLNITASNDAPVNTVPGAQSVDEDTTLAISGLSVADIDTADGFQVNLTAGSGTLTVPTAGGASVTGNGTSAVQLSGTLAQVNAALAGLSYQGNFNFTGTDALSIVTDDGSSGTDSDTVAIAVTPVNDPPVNTVPGAQSAIEDTALPIAGLSVADIDSATLTTTLTATNGTLAIVAGPARVAGFLTNSLTISGTIAEVNAALASVQYLGNANFTGADTLTVTSDDGTASDVDTVAITVAPQPDAPEIDLDPDNSSGAPGSGYITTFTENGPPALLTDAVSLTDADDAVLVGATFRLINTQPGDTLVVNGTLPSGITASLVGNELTLSGTASVAAYRTALGQIAFDNPGEAPEPGNRLILVRVDDGSAATNAFVVVQVQALNDAPVLGSVAASAAFTAGGPATTLSPALTTTDVDNSGLAAATVSITAGFLAGDLLAATTTGTTITASYDSASGILTLTGSDTLAHYQQVLDSVTYQSTAGNPTNSGLNPTRTIAWQLNDGESSDNLSLTQTTTVTLTAAPPVPGEVSGDFNGDFNPNTRSDILWRADNGEVSTWDMANAGAGAAYNVLGVVPTTSQIHGVGDFNGDGRSDLLWRADDGEVSIWEMAGAGGVAAYHNLGVIPTSSHIRGTGDFSGDGRSDILWRADNGEVSIWEMANAGAATAYHVLGVIPTSSDIQGTGDFNGDGKTDILWRADNGEVSIWEMANAGEVAAYHVLGVIPATSHILGTGDFNGDGKSDILWRADNGEVSTWEMANAGQVQAYHVLDVVPTTSHVRGTGDYSGDGKSDILWRADNGEVSTWEMANAGQVQGYHVLGIIPAISHIQHAGQFDLV